MVGVPYNPKKAPGGTASPGPNLLDILAYALAPDERAMQTPWPFSARLVQDATREAIDSAIQPFAFGMDTLQGKYGPNPVGALTGIYSSPEEAQYYSDPVNEGTVDAFLSEGAQVPMNLNLAGLSGNFDQLAKGAVDPNVLNMFFGPRSKTADLEALNTATEMDFAKRTADEGWGYRSDASITPEQIFDETGWFRGADGLWRYEKPDDEMAINPDNFRKDAPTGWLSSVGRLGGVGPEGLTPVEEEFNWIADSNPVWDRFSTEPQVFDDALFEAYPELKEIRAVLKYKPPGQESNYYEGGYYNPEAYSRPHGKIEGYGGDIDILRSVILHEISHAVARKEGFDTGGNTGAAKHVLSNLAPSADLQLQLADPMKVYKSITGEVEARNVQRRDELRGAGIDPGYPWQTEDVPREFQLRPEDLINAVGASEQERALLLAKLAALKGVNIPRWNPKPVAWTDAMNGDYVIPGWGKK